MMQPLPPRPRLALRPVCVELLPCIVGHHVDCRQLHRVVAHPPVDLPAQCGQASAALAFSCLLFAPLQVRPCVTVTVTVIVIVTVLVSVVVTLTVTVKMPCHTPLSAPFPAFLLCNYILCLFGPGSFSLPSRSRRRAGMEGRKKQRERGRGGGELPNRLLSKWLGRR